MLDVDSSLASPEILPFASVRVARPAVPQLQDAASQDFAVLFAVAAEQPAIALRLAHWQPQCQVSSDSGEVQHQTVLQSDSTNVDWNPPTWDRRAVGRSLAAHGRSSRYPVVSYID